MPEARQVSVENVNHPGVTKVVDGTMYRAMRAAMLEALPPNAPGLTAAEVAEAVVEYLPAELFPRGEKAGWWAKTVQLDLEAKGLVAREATTPLRLHKVARA